MKIMKRNNNKAKWIRAGFIGIFALAAICIVICLFTMPGCTEIITPTPTAKPESVFETGAKANEESARSALQNIDIPKITFSADADNVARRLAYLNQDNQVGYLYIFQNGILIQEVRVRNKVTSINTFLTPMEEIRKIYEQYKYGEGGWPAGYITVEAADLDGTYGVNADGVFWFEPDGNYQELLGTGYVAIFSANRKSYSTQPILFEVP